MEDNFKRFCIEMASIMRKYDLISIDAETDFGGSISFHTEKGVYELSNYLSPDSFESYVKGK
jgi:hypothetical protein